MTVYEYLTTYTTGTPQITFIKARARKDAHTPYYHAEYQTTPLFQFEEALKTRLQDYIILNDDMQSITWLSGADWNNLIRKGFAKCLLVISQEDHELLYPNEEQRRSMIEYIDEKIIEKYRKR